MSERDWPEVSRIYQQGIDTGLATLQPNCPSFAEWDLAHLKVCRLAAMKEEKVIGWAALTPISGRCVYAGVAEVSVYVDPGYWGLGVGKALLKELVRSSEEEGLWTLQSGILQENVASIRLHERCGFRMVGYRERIGRDRNGKWRDTVLMEKRSSKNMGEVSPPSTKTSGERVDI
jgi:L-amino acid N-acyltransferase YncA